MFLKSPKVKGKIFFLPIDKIEPAPNQPRKYFGNEELESLSRSIAQNGLLVPVSVRKKSENRYELIAGERRLRACKILGLTEIAAMVEDFEDTQSAVMTFIENIHRKDLNVFEEAEGIRALMQTTGLNQSKICSMLDMSQSTVANKLRLLRLSDNVKSIAIKYGIGERLCRALLQLPTEELQQKACRVIGEKKLNTQKAEEYIYKLMSEKNKEEKNKIIIRDYRIILNSVNKLVDDIKLIGLKVSAKATEEDKFIYYTICVEKKQV